MAANTDSFSANGYSNVNGIRMYYEIYGDGNPMVLIHGGGSTIQTSFGQIIPHLAKKRKLIAVELQAHGRTGDRNNGISFEQDADDVVQLLSNLNIPKTDIFGFSNGGTTALQMAIRHPERCDKIIGASLLTKREGALPQFWEFMKNGTFAQMPQQYKNAFMAVTPDSEKLFAMYQKCADRMNRFADIPDQALRSIKSPVLLINGEMDVATSDHIRSVSTLIPNCRFSIFAGGHGAYLGEITTLTNDFKVAETTLSVIDDFLDNR